MAGGRVEAPRSERWAGRPVLSAVVLCLAHGIPVVAAVVTSAVVSRHMERPEGMWATLGSWALLFAASTLVLLGVDRFARRLLPLAALLKLSMLFPDRAPRRMAVARRAGSVRNLADRLAEAKALGADDEPTRAAEVILALVGALHAHDRHTRGHSERVRWFTDLIAEELKLPAGDRDRLRWAALLHDIGKLHISPKILNKPGQLGRREWRHIHRHPEAGAQLAAPLAPWLGEWGLTIAQHHEKWDGSGYPARLRGDEICLGARIVAVADSYEVMTAVRAYKKAQTATAARKELTRCAGTHFDPTIVRAFLSISIGRLRWVTGPLAWVAQVPFIGWVPRLAEGAAAIGGQAAGVVGTAAGAAVLSSTTFVSSPEPLVVQQDETPAATDVAVPVPVPDATTATTAPGPRVLASTLTKAATVSSPSGEVAPEPTTTTLVPGKGNANGLADSTASPTTTAAPARGPGATADASTLSPGKATGTTAVDPTAVTDKLPPGQIKK